MSNGVVTIRAAHYREDAERLAKTETVRALAAELAFGPHNFDPEEFGTFNFMSAARAKAEKRNVIGQSIGAVGEGVEIVYNEIKSHGDDYSNEIADMKENSHLQFRLINDFAKELFEKYGDEYLDYGAMYNSIIDLHDQLAPILLKVAEQVAPAEVLSRTFTYCFNQASKDNG